MTATYTKLNNGQWGVRITGGVPRAGLQVTVVTKNGVVKTEIVSDILWSGPDKKDASKKVFLCSIVKKAAEEAAPATSHTTQRTCPHCGGII